MAKVEKVKVVSDSEELKWRAEEDARTLERAEEIKNDPARLKRAMNVAREKMDAMKSLMSAMKSK